MLDIRHASADHCYAVLQVEDIIDTGATLKAVIAKLGELGAASVKSAVLLNKEERRNVVIEPDYAALKARAMLHSAFTRDANQPLWMAQQHLLGLTSPAGWACTCKPELHIHADQCSARNNALQPPRHLGPGLHSEPRQASTKGITYRICMCSLLLSARLDQCHTSS